MPIFESACAWALAAYDHVRETGHEVIVADDPRIIQLGISCVDCGSDPGTLWMLPVRNMAEMRLNPRHPLGQLVRTRTRRMCLVSLINRNSVNPMGLSIGWIEDPVITASIPADFWDRVRAFEAGEEVEPFEVPGNSTDEYQPVLLDTPDEVANLQALWPVPEEEERGRWEQSLRQIEAGREAEVARAEARRTPRFDRDPVEE